MDHQFEQHELRLLDEIEEVEIETVRSDTQKPHNVTIWVVVVGPNVYVRSINGAQAHWYRQLHEQSCGTIHANDRKIPIHAVPVLDEPTQSLVNDAYRRKYELYPQDVAWIVAPEVQRTTLRVMRGAAAT
jgi:hypothetical protein